MRSLQGIYPEEFQRYDIHLVIIFIEHLLCAGHCAKNVENDKIKEKTNYVLKEVSLW